MSHDLNWFGPWFRLTREAKGLGRQAISRRTQIHLSTIKQIEGGENAGHFKTIQRLADSIGYDIVPVERGK